MEVFYNIFKTPFLEYLRTMASLTRYDANEERIVLRTFS